MAAINGWVKPQSKTSLTTRSNIVCRSNQAVIKLSRRSCSLEFGSSLGGPQPSWTSSQHVTAIARHSQGTTTKTFASVNGSSVLSHEEWDHTHVRSASVKYNDSPLLKMRRRAVLQWASGRPSQVLIVKKPGNAAASNMMKEMGDWLKARDIRVLVERSVHRTEVPQFDPFDPQRDSVDMCITLGGDGTVLHLASLFEGDVPLPPVVSFAMGTLGFLTPFDASDFDRCLTRILDTSAQPVYCTLRARKRCELRQAGRLVCVHHTLNEVVIDRGAFPGAVLLELFVDDSFVTNVEADGLIISTPSGSTAYSMSAGGPMIAPSVPCTILTPIAPLSLSFRPVVVPETSNIIINLPTYARSHGRVSFDGKKALRMRKDTSLTVTTSLFPLPMVQLGELDRDWYEGITQKLKWNQTIRQPPRLPGSINTVTVSAANGSQDDGGSSSSAAPSNGRGAAATCA